MSGAAITVPRRAGLARTQTLVQRPSSIGGCALLAQRAVQLDAQSEKSGNFDAAAAAQAMALYQRACAGLDCLAASGDEVAARGLATYLPRLSELAARLRCRARDVYEERGKSPLMLVINVQEARDLAPKDKNGLSDPYCTLHISAHGDTGDVFTTRDESHREQMRKTARIDATLDPQWNETFRFVIAPGDVITCAVYDYDKVGSDDFEGQVVLKEQIERLFHLPLGLNQSAFYTLHPRPEKLKERVTGQVRLSMFLAEPDRAMRPHQFRKTHFSKPTNCQLCESFIWGLGKQGVQCNECAFVAHKKCQPFVPSSCGVTFDAGFSAFPPRESMGAGITLNGQLVPASLVDPNLALTLEAAADIDPDAAAAATANTDTPSFAAAPDVQASTQTTFGAMVDVAPARSSGPIANLEQLTTACSQGDVSAVRATDLNGGLSSALNDHNASGKTALICAASSGNADIVKILLDAGADPNGVQQGTNSTALHAAAFGGHASVIRRLLASGADPNAVNSNGVTPAHSACDAGDLPCATLLFGSDEGPNGDPNVPDRRGWTGLHYAAYKGHSEIVEMLLTMETGRATVSAKDKGGRTPLALAQKGLHLNEVGALLLANGASSEELNMDSAAKKWLAEQQG